jgi:predicted transporter
MAAIVANNTLPFSVIFNPASVIGTLVTVCCIFFILVYFSLGTLVAENLSESSELTIGFIILITFVSMEIYNILLSFMTGSTYYPTNPAYYGNFWFCRGLNFLLAAISTVIVAYITRKDLENL